MKLNFLNFLISSALAGASVSTFSPELRSAFSRIPETVSRVPSTSKQNLPKFSPSLFSFSSKLSTSSKKFVSFFNEKIEAGDINAVKALLDKNPKFIKSPSMLQYREDGLVIALYNGQTSIAELLLKSGNINPTVRNNEAICIASAYGNIDGVRLLLKNPDVYPPNEVLLLAVTYEHKDIVRLLLDNGKIWLDAGADNNQAIIHAARARDTDMVRLLLSRPEVDAGAMNNKAVNLAAGFGHIENMKLLLAHPSVKASQDGVLLRGDFNAIKNYFGAGYKIDQNTLQKTLEYARIIKDWRAVQFLESLKKRGE